VAVNLPKVVCFFLQLFLSNKEKVKRLYFVKEIAMFCIFCYDKKRRNFDEK